MSDPWGMLLLVTWIALCIGAMITFIIWFDVWVKVHYKVWETYDDDTEETDGKDSK